MSNSGEIGEGISGTREECDITTSEPRFAGEYAEQLRAHWREWTRAERRRNCFSEKRYQSERAQTLQSAWESLSRTGYGPVTPPSLVQFQWTHEFSASNHCLGNPDIHLVEIPPLAARAAPEHKVSGDSLLGGTTTVVYSASWAMQIGRHPDATYEGMPIDYFSFAPTYLRINVRNMRTIFGDTGRIVAVVTPSVPEPERKLIEYGHCESPEFCHPMFYASARELFAPRFLGRDGKLLPIGEIRRRLAGLVLAGYSFGCTVLLQHIRWVASELITRGMVSDEVQDVLARVLCVLIAPNIDFDSRYAVPTIATRSPLDAVISGSEDLGLFSTVRRDRSSELFSPEEREKLSRGEWETINARRPPLWLAANVAQFNFALPGVVRYDANGNRLHPFIDAKHGHDIKAYLAALQKNPEILEAIAFAEANENADGIDLRRFWPERMLGRGRGDCLP